METIYDVLRELIKLLGAGALHEKALEVIDAADPAVKPEPEPEPEPAPPPPVKPGTVKHDPFTGGKAS